MSLRTRLVLAAAYLLIAVVVALEIPLAANISRRFGSEAESQLLIAATLAASRISDDLPQATADPADPAPRTAIASLVRASAEAAGARMVVVDREGLVQFDSTGQSAVGERYATPERPEFASTFSVEGGRIDVTRRHSETLRQDLLIVTVPVVHERQVVGAVRATKPLGEVASRVREAWIGLAVIGAAAVAAGLILAWLLATSLATPVRRLRDAAARFGEGDLDARAPQAGPKEVATLAGAFNSMASALAASLRSQRDFVANASHQLRTPLTGLSLRLEAIRAGGGEAAGEAAKAESEVSRLEDLVDDLLVLARASSLPPTGEVVDLGTLAEQAVERWRAAADRAGIAISSRLESSPVWASPADLAQVLDNLLENAIRYCAPGADIAVETTARDGLASLVVADTGPGIPEDERSRVFDRFYRGTTGRRAGPGTGLGLAVVAELVQRWGGRVHLSDGRGTTVQALFPRPATVS